MKAKHLALLGLLATATLMSTAKAAWPDDKPIEIVVGYAPGGGTDLMARKLFPLVQKRLGPKAQFVVVNKAGASGEIGNAYVAKAAPDGYTLGIVNVPPTLYLPMIRKTQYQWEDLQLVARIVDDPSVLVTRSDSKFDSFQAVLAEAKKNPKTVTIGHNGEGSNGDLIMQMLRSELGVEFNGVPYKGTGPQKIDVQGGHTPLGTVTVGEIPELHKGVKVGQAGLAGLKALVQFSEKRSPSMPDVPTTLELGLKVTMSSERGLGAPKGVPESIIKRLEAAIAETLRDPEFLASSAIDAPVIAFLSGSAWAKSLEHNRLALKKIALGNAR
ncbi:MAG: hypothetical protein RLZZ502_1337 [Pseudomonadota bacterium]